MTTTPHPLETAPLARLPPARRDDGDRARRYTLGGILTGIALNAVAGGLYGLSGADGVPVEWLEGSPFSSYFVPSLVLLVGVGGTAALSALAVLGRRRSARRAASLAGLVLVAWIAAQVSIIGWVSWLQPAVALAGVVVWVLALALPRSPA